MDFSRTHEKLVSFAVSAMISSAFLSTAPGPVMTAAAGPQPQAVLQAVQALHAAGFQGTANMALPSPAAAPIAVSFNPTATGPILTDAHLKKYDAWFVQFGIDTVLGKPITDALGLTAGPQTLKVRELAIDTKTPLAKHGMARIPERGGFIFIRVTPDGSRSYAANDKQELVSAVFSSANGGEPVVLAVADAQKQLVDELTFWAKSADGA